MSKEPPLGLLFALAALCAVCSSSSAAAGGFAFMGGSGSVGPGSLGPGSSNNSRTPAGPAAGPAAPPAAKSEVFYVKGSEAAAYTIAKDGGAAACQAVGAVLATKAQVTEAQATGKADWCAAGWVSDDDESVWPVTTNLNPGCGNLTTPGVVRWTPDTRLAGVNCYGVKPAKGSNNLVLPFNSGKWSRYQPALTGTNKEVYYVKGTPTSAYEIPNPAASETCQALGGVLATKVQVTEAQSGGQADWCAAGWVSDDAEAVWPVTTSLVDGCGRTTPGVVRWTPDTRLAGVNCYGVKPAKDTDARILPFNASKWSR